MTKRDRRKPGGYAARRETKKAIEANAKARDAIQKINDHIDQAPQISQLLIAHLLTTTALALASGAAALHELERIYAKEPAR